MQNKIIKKLKSFLSYSLKLFILTSFLLSQSFIAEIFLYQNNPNTKSINTAQADYNDHWYNQSFLYRKQITIPRSINSVPNVPHTDSNNTNPYLSNFPILVSTTIPTDKVRSDHNDIIFTSQNGTQLLNYEIESYNTSGDLTAWVKLPQLNDANNTTDTSFYVYYDNSGYTTVNSTSSSVWDSNFKMVQHINQNPGGTAPQMMDSTSNHNNGTAQGSMTSANQTTGQIDGASSFNGTSQYINVNDASSLNPSSTITVDAWVKLNELSRYQYIVDKRNTVSPWTSYALYLNQPNNLIYFSIDNQNSSRYTVISDRALSIGSLYHIVGTLNSSGAVNLYINGVKQQSQGAFTGSILAAGSSLKIGTGGNEYVNGTIDEVRISDTARSADWIKTEYNNESNPNTFSTLSLEENLLPPTITSLSANLPNGTYGTGTTIPITINFSKDVTSTGNITLTLNTTPQRTCSFTITNNNSATCNYTIQSGDSAINLNATISGNIHDQFNNPMTNFIPTSNLSDNTIININTSSSPFIPPTKPNITNIDITVLDNGTTTFNLPSNITQIAISRTPDFANVSWQDFDQDKFSHINETQETLYLKFRTNEGAVSDTIIITPQSSINNPVSLIDGDIIQCKSSNDPNAVYIVKIIGTKTYIRHITSIQIFNYYKHLKWENLKQVDSLTLSPFPVG